MKSTILSLNIGEPELMEWRGQSIRSSMRKQPVEGPLIVHSLQIEGDSFASASHGTPDSVLYAFGLPSAQACATRIGLTSYLHGALGENLTLDDFDEFSISVGDTFKIGGVLAQAHAQIDQCSYQKQPQKINPQKSHHRRQIQHADPGERQPRADPIKNRLSDRAQKTNQRIKRVGAYPRHNHRNNHH